MTDKAYNGIAVGWDKEEDLIESWKAPRTNYQKVGAFMRSMEQEILPSPTFPSEQVQRLRVALIAEELEELETAMDDNDIVEVADALTDLLYVVYGAGHAFGIDLDKCFAEVHRSNMTKLGPDGKAIRREDGKVLKPETYEPPNLKDIIHGN